jgi:fructose-1,6-bisphosphatase II
MEAMVGREDVFFSATGITQGALLGGVRYLPGGRAETHSIVMRAATRTVRFIKALHHLEHKPQLVRRTEAG